MLFRELVQSDIDYMANHSVSRGIFSKMPQQTEFSFCLEDKGKILGVGGVRLINLTTSWAWVDLTHYAGEHIITVYRVIKEWMEILARDKGIKRLQAYVEVDFPKSKRMVEHLSFHQEHIMPKFVGEKSAYLYVRHFDGD